MFSPIVSESTGCTGDRLCGVRPGVMRLNGFSPTAYVYALVSEDAVIYVGETTDLRHRLKSHRKDKAFDSVYFWLAPLDREERLDLEHELQIKFADELYQAVMSGKVPPTTQLAMVPGIDT